MAHLLENVSANGNGAWVDFALDGAMRESLREGALMLFVRAGTWDGANVAIEITDSDENAAYAVTDLATLTENTAAKINFIASKIRAVVSSAGGSTAGIYVTLEPYK